MILKVEDGFSRLVAVDLDRARSPGLTDPSLTPWRCGTTPVLELVGTARIDGERPDGSSCAATVSAPPGPVWQNFDIFEGTEQIQQLVIARAISGLRIE